MNTEQKLADSLGISYEIKQVSIDRHSVNYLTAGSGQPVLLIHGGNIGWGQWYPNIPELSQYFSIYAIDLPGAGRSSRINYARLNLDRDFINTAEEFIRHVIRRPTHVIGSSIGGWIVLKLAMRGRVDVNKLVIADSLGFTDRMRIFDRIIGLRFVSELIVRTVLKPVKTNKKIESFLRSVFYNKKFSISKDFVEYFYETMQTSHNLLLISALSNFTGMRKEFILKDQLASLCNDILIIWGLQDKMLPFHQSRNSFRLLKNSKIVEFNNVGHIPSIERAGEFNREVVRFLNK